jgi:selenophosphate synthase
MEPMTYRLTQYAHGGGCACKILPVSWKTSSVV